MRRLIKVIRRYRLVGALMITVLVFGGVALRQYQHYRRMEDVHSELMATWLRQQIHCFADVDTHLVQALLETDAGIRAESLQNARNVAERGYSLLFVAPFANPWRYDFIMKTMYHVPWGNFVDYLDYTSQLKETLPFETRVALNELRQRLMSLQEHTTKLRDLIYGPDWRVIKHRPLSGEGSPKKGSPTLSRWQRCLGCCMPMQMQKRVPSSAKKPAIGPAGRGSLPRNG